MLDISVFIRYNKLIKRNREIKEEKKYKRKEGDSTGHSNQHFII